jgi:hypothetical protein
VHVIVGGEWCRGEGGGDVAEGAEAGDLGPGRVGQNVDENRRHVGSGAGRAHELANGGLVAAEPVRRQIPGQLDELDARSSFVRKVDGPCPAEASQRARLRTAESATSRVMFVRKICDVFDVHGAEQITAR